MRKIVSLLLIVALSAVASLRTSAYNSMPSEENPPVSNPEIIFDNSSTTTDNRENSFPFHVEYNGFLDALVVSYCHNGQAGLYLTDANGKTINQQIIYTEGNYVVSLPESSETLYLFMITPTLYAYVSITR